MLTDFFATNLTDGGSLSLREAIILANSNGTADTIYLGAGTHVLSITGAGEDASATGDLDILYDVGNELTIVGAGAGVSIVDATGLGDRVFHILDGASVTLQGLTVTGGSSSLGGGIAVDAGSSLTVSDSEILNNSSTGKGGGIAVDMDSSLTVSNSEVSNNSSANLGGGIAVAAGSSLTVSNSEVLENSGASGGGGIYSREATLTVQDSLLMLNDSNGDGGGIYNDRGSAVVERSTISENMAGSHGGGIITQVDGAGGLTVTDSTFVFNIAQSRGGGIYVFDGPTDVSSSTFSANTANLGGAIFANDTLTVSSSTLFANAATTGGAGGGIYRASGTVTVGNTIIAGNMAPTDPDVRGIFVSADFNLIGDGGSSNGFTAAADQVGTAASPINPVLGPLQDNGGATVTHAVLLGSPALNAGFDLVGAGLDQRAFLRPVGSIAAVGGDGSDIGAFELQMTDPTANDDSAMTDEDQAVTIDVLDNDTGSDGALDPLEIVSVTNGSKGTTVIDDKGTTDTTDDEIVYTPNLGETGVDTFMYTISDGDGGMDTATATVDIKNLVDISGRVYDDLNNDGAFDPGESGIGGVTVEVWDQAMTALFGSAVTAGDGTYFLNVNLGAGTYKIVEVVDELVDLGLLDGNETAGNIGGTVDNAQDSNEIADISVGAPGTTADAVDYLFAEIRPSDITGFVWQDFNDDGLIDFGELSVENAEVALTGTDDRGNTVAPVVDLTDVDGAYVFFNLRPGDYTLTETQPAGLDDGLDSLGTVNGVVTGDDAVNDQFSNVILPPDSSGANYNFGERPAADGVVEGSSQTATIGFWQNKNGQNLVKSLNGGSGATQLGDWLAAAFPNMYGSGAGDNNLSGRTNTAVADFYKDLFKRNKKSAAGGGPPKVDAQVLATALAVYVTNETLAGTVAEGFGFDVTTNGLGVRTFNVEDNGAAFGIANGSDLAVLDLLLAVNEQSINGLLYDLNGDGDTDDGIESLFRTMANDVFSAINEAGDI